MPGVLLHVGAVVQCTHFAPATNPPVQPRAAQRPTRRDRGKPVHRCRCPFTIPGPKPQPCVTLKWLMPATRMLINGQPALLQTPPGPGSGAGLC